MRFGTWLLAMAQPLAAKIMIGLGLSMVSIVGIDSVMGALKTTLIANINSMPVLWLDFALYLWIGKGIGIIFGAMTTRLALWSIQNATSMLGKSA